MAELKNCTTQFTRSLCGVNVTINPQQRIKDEQDRVLIIGQKSDNSPAGEGLHLVKLETKDDLFGYDSMINAQIDDFLELSADTEVWAYILPNTGDSGKSTVTVTGIDTATATGSIYLWVNGNSYQVPFDPETDTNQSVAGKLQAVITASDTSLIVIAEDNKVKIETKAKGAIGGFLDVRKSYEKRLEQRSSDEVTIAIKTTQGTGNPNLSKLEEVNEGFEFVINPYTDSQSISSVSTYLCKQWSGGDNSRAFGVFYGGFEQAKAFATNTNNALISYIGANGALTPSYLESSSYGAIAFNLLNSLSKNIANSLSGEAMPSMLASEKADEYTDKQKAELIENGMGYFNVGRNNKVSIGRAVTTYTTSDDGAYDTSLQSVNKVSQMAQISKLFRTKIAEKYAGYAFRSDGVTGTGGKIATLSGIRNYVISLAQDLSNRNVIQHLDKFIENVQVFKNKNGCIEIQVEPEVIEQTCCFNVTLNVK